MHFGVQGQSYEKLTSNECRLSMILVKEMAPTPESLGATNGLVQFAMSFTRSICPAFARYVDGWLSHRMSVAEVCKPETVRSLRCWLVANSPRATSGLLLWLEYRMPGLCLAVKSNAAENRSSVGPCDGLLPYVADPASL
jgi:hypothetical protein